MVSAANGTTSVIESGFRPGGLSVVRNPGSHDHAAGHWPRVFTREGVHPFETIEWKLADAEIRNSSQEVKFSQKGVEVPEFWNQNTINVVADKYFRVVDGVKEKSVKQIFLRVANVLTEWAREQDFFNSDADATIYKEELLYALIHQYGAFNSPVWFNLGIPGRKQAASACFISGVDDTLDSIADFAKSEKVIFAGGSGSGANLSKLRSSFEKLSSGSYVCGPLGWMEELDKGAKAMKSGGSTRNAAKMVVLDMDHPDIFETLDGRPGFIPCKAIEETRAHDLISKCGYSAAYDDPNSAYKWVSFQNANHSVSVPNAFMKAVVNDGDWVTRERLTGKQVKTYKARDLWNEISKAAWICGDPGVQFTDHINDWHTVPNSGRINSSNPCFHPDTRIATEHGLVRIEDLCAEYESDAFSSPKFLTLVQTPDGPSLKEAAVFPTGVKKVVEVHTRRGRVLKVTSNHRLMTTEGWMEASDLTVDSTLCLQAGPGAHGTEASGLDLMWHKIAGWIVGDGWILKSLPCRNTHEVGLLFGKDDKDVMEKVLSFFQSNDIPYSAKPQSGSVGESPDYVRIHRKSVWESMSTWACEPGSKAPTKKIMEAVYRSTLQEQLAFLSGLFSADGTFNIQPKKNIDARFGSTSLELLRGIQALLLNLGVNSTIHKDRRPNDKPTFSYTTKSGEVRTYHSKEKMNDLIITGQSLKTFKSLMLSVGLLSERKQERFSEIPDAVNNYGRDRWTDEVVEIIDRGEMVTVYDITEPETSSLIANGVVAHNCSEFLHVDDTACNLCAINLTKFFDEIPGSDLSFNFERFEQAVRVFSTAQMAIVDMADYPTEKIRVNSMKLRPIGTNYGDLGALLMKMGYSYDSDAGRAVAARLASLMTGITYKTASLLASRVGSFPDFNMNRVPMMNVMKMHREANLDISGRWRLGHQCPLGTGPSSAEFHSKKVWNDVMDLGSKYGFYISQATLQAPLGTISFLMGMDTTGIEPSFSLVSYKSCVGGGFMKLVNGAVSGALHNLGYTDDEVEIIGSYITDNDCIEGAPGLKPEHLPVFDCAMPSGLSGRYLSPMAHIQMMAAIQPLITCAQSKTVNLPSTVTPKEIGDVYLESWKLGVKCIALYRDGCKMSQPLATKVQSEEVVNAAQEVVIKEIHVTKRRHMPEDVDGKRHRFSINNHKGYVVLNNYPDGTLGEVFLKFGKNGSTMGGLIDGFTQLLSIALQYGVPLDKLIRSFVHTKFEPSGMTRNPNIRFADSLYDYLFKLLDISYYGGVNSGLDHRLAHQAEVAAESDRPLSDDPIPSHRMDVNAPPCGNCGAITARNGSCYLCMQCGTSSGCS